jgi:hypothetical protein
MKTNNRLYAIVKQIHLYSALITATLLLMYIITSYMMIYHDWFKVEQLSTQSAIFKTTAPEISAENWPSFLEKHAIKGRMVQENLKQNGDLVRIYSSTGGNNRITISKDKNEVKIKTTQLNLSGHIIGFHRLRGYGGSIYYNIYAFLLDLVGISLVLFAITGVILWLKLLKHNKIAWAILILGFTYVSFVVGYLVIM